MTQTDIICPICGKPVAENGKAYGCTGWKEGCKFTIWKNFIGSVVSPTEAKELVEGKIITKRLTSKAGKTWDQQIYFDKDTGKVEFVANK